MEILNILMFDFCSIVKVLTFFKMPKTIIDFVYLSAPFVYFLHALGTGSPLAFFYFVLIQPAHVLIKRIQFIVSNNIFSFFFWLLQFIYFQNYNFLLSRPLVIFDSQLVHGSL